MNERYRAKRLISEIYYNNQKLFTLKPADFEDKGDYEALILFAIL
ncbi:hypothetical protein [Pedobacter ginsenosidimutans]|nr:hypothetical protein [Pedobacter ginsenosidimutans]